MADARFSEGDEQPLRLIARDADDLNVVSACIQDAVATGDQLSWDRKKRSFALLISRFRWEDSARRTERVQALLQISDVLRVQSTGVSRDADMVLSLLSLGWDEAAEGAGRLDIQLAGDGVIRLDVECLEVSLADVSRPYGAPSGKRPAHPE